MDRAPSQTPALRADLIAFLDGWVKAKNITACPACRASDWHSWQFAFLDSQISTPEPHYTRTCGNCGQVQLFRAEVMFPFTWNGALAIDEAILLRRL